MSVLGDRIKEYREKRGMTQEELALKIGYKTKFAVSKVENGKNDMPLDRVKLVADVLDVNPLYLIGIHSRTPEEQAEIDAWLLTNPELREMLELYYQLTPEKQKAVRDMVKALSL